MNTKEQYKLFKKALKEAHYEDFLKLVQEVDLLSPINEEGDYPLIYAIKYKNTHFEHLFKAGASINVCDENGITALMHLTDTKKYHSSNLKEYLKQANNFKQQDNQGNTLLIHLAQNADIRMLNELKERIHECGLDIQNKEGNNAIMAIFKNQQKPNHQIILKYLIEQGSSIDLINKHNENLYLMAIKSNSQIRVEIIENAHPKIDLTQRDSDGLCAFDYAVDAENIDLMKKTFHPMINLDNVKKMRPFIENPQVIDFINALLEQERLEENISPKESKNKVKL
jgi:ankyrin repeat protein